MPFRDTFSALWRGRRAGQTTPESPPPLPGERSVMVEGDVVDSVIVTGDRNHVQVGRVSSFTLTALPPRPEVPGTAGPAALLVPQYELVPFVGRHTERTHLATWLGSSESRAAHLITGQGGQGKTRLALQASRDAAALGWHVLHARHHHDSVDRRPELIPGGEARVLVVVDYADLWPLPDLLELFATCHRRAWSSTRFLLLARSHTFWPTLVDRLDDAGCLPTHVALPDVPDSPADRTAAYEAAADAFARQYELVDPPRRRPSDLSGTDFQLMLAIQVAALVDVLDRTDPLPLGPSAIGAGPGLATERLLRREVTHWARMQVRKPDPVTVSTTVMGRAVALATLTGGLPDREAVALADRLTLGAPGRTIVDDHRLCYPTDTPDDALAPLLPDRLGEDLLAHLLPGSDTGNAVIQPDPAVTDLLKALLTNEIRTAGPGSVPLRPALTVLVESALRWPHVRDGHLLPAITHDPHIAIAAGGPVIARLALVEAPPGTLDPLRRRLTEILGPGTHLTLAVGAAALSERHVAENRNAPPPVLAPALGALANHLAAVGRREQALTTAEEAVTLYRELAAHNRDAYLPDLAASVNTLANHLAEMGRREQALSVWRTVGEGFEGADRHHWRHLEEAFRWVGTPDRESECTWLREHPDLYAEGSEHFLIHALQYQALDEAQRYLAIIKHARTSGVDEAYRRVMGGGGTDG